MTSQPAPSPENINIDDVGRSANRRPLHAVWLGRRPYAETYALQLQLHEYTKTAEHDTLLLLEHEPTITQGRGAHAEHLLAAPALLAERGVALTQTDRGGDITLHAPGQLVAYPIVNLGAQGPKDVRRYVNHLTSCMQQLVAQFGVDAGKMPEMIGLWADQADYSKWPGDEQATAPVKLGAIGVRISRWVTMHGFALNLTTDLSLFQLIVPCGISSHPVSSIEMLTGHTPSVAQVARHTQGALCSLLERDRGRWLNYDGPLEPAALLESLGSLAEE